MEATIHDSRSIRHLLYSSFPFLVHRIATIKAISISHRHSSFTSTPRRQEDDSRNVRVSVWWDFENCSIPAGANVFKVANYITAAVRANGIKGPVQITAFGDVLQLSRTNQEALSSTGINITHIPNGGKNSADRSLLVDLMYWVSQNPPPAYLFLISGDRDFSGILHRLRMNNYNILLASPESAPIVLCGAASIMWKWSSLAKGENLIGKHYNLPPDGPYNSWYGHQRAPLVDPYGSVEQPPKSKDVSEPAIDSKPRPIPKTVLNQIRQILSSFPKGLSIIDLRSELGKSNLTLDKELYGYKKFSHFLLSMTNILRLQTGNDGQISVHGISPPVNEVTPNSETTNAKSRVNDEHATDAKSSNRNMKAPPSLLPSAVCDTEKTPVTGNQLGNAATEDISVSDVCPESNQTVEAFSNSEGFFRKLWAKWFESLGNADRSGSKLMQGSNKEAKGVGEGVIPSSPSSLKDKPPHDDRNRSPEKSAYELDTSSSFISKLVDWCKCIFRKDGEVFEASKDLAYEKAYKDSSPLKCEPFSEELWNEVESFLSSPEGLANISVSKTREEVAESLQKNGPMILKSLQKGETVHLVDMLISEKKWITQSSSGLLPFKLNLPIGKDPHMGVRCSNGLRSLFTTDPSQPPKQVKGDSSAVSKRKEKSRDEVLSDCRRLVMELVRGHPKGCNIGLFPKQFTEKYGYVLDYQALGYPKLASLLQIMPGVSVESNHIIPIRRARDAKAEIVQINDEAISDCESPWEELGPVSSSNVDESETTPESVDRESEEQDGRSSFKECLLSEDEYSDDEAEGISGQEKKDDQSPLLQILDSWYSPDGGKGESDIVGGDDGCSSDSWRSGTHNGGSHGKKSWKSYSFVADCGSSGKDKLVQGVLSSLKKSGEARV